jgi:uncharacterized protein YaiI (UPF0178 family)
MIMFKIYVDADSCPVKQEIYRVANRYSIKVILVANKALNIPEEGFVEIVVVDDGQDAVDDWITVNVNKNDIVITADIPLASRTVKKGARILSPRGIAFNEASIGDTLATRDLMTHLRDIGLVTGGPPAFGKKYRSQFLQALDSLIQAIRNGK